MKFGGTSVGDASCIFAVARIIRAAARDSSLVVVVSAMSGVTNKLIEMAGSCVTGDRGRVAVILQDLREQHHSAAAALTNFAAGPTGLVHKLDELLNEADCLCQEVMLRHELTLRALDSIAGFGERLSTPLVAAALEHYGLASETIESTEIISTNSNYGSADPLMDLTRQRCEERLRPLLHRGIVPVVTGFIGSTTEGVLTTLGRGGSDYSATILGAALGVDEVIIWTDVDGVLTADPRLVPGARTIPEISYREAADLAYFGAKVLHPKTLRPVMRDDIPVWIRNTFSPEQLGTKITTTAPPSEFGVRAVTAISNLALVSVGGPDVVGIPNLLGRTLTTVDATQTEILLISRSSSQDNVSFVVSSASVSKVVEALRQEFAEDFAHESVEHISVEASVAMITLVGQGLAEESGLVGRTLSALAQESLGVIAMAQESLGSTSSVVVAQENMQSALVAAHREFRLGTLNSQGTSDQNRTNPYATSAADF